MKVAVIGATGLVGTEMLKVLEEFNIEISELIPVASENSVGKQIYFKGKAFTVKGMEEAIAMKPDFALFSAGGQTSLTYAPRFAEVGTIVVDNSSAWRMHEDVPLVVPEINLHTIQNAKIIANPNCSTIQMVMALAPLHKEFTIKRLVISTYQSVSGTGKAAMDQLNGEKKGESPRMIYPHPIEGNVIPQCDVFTENDYTKEEMKMVNETRKILGDASLRITATCARVPVKIGHSESVNIEFEKPFEMEEVKEILRNTEGVTVMENDLKAEYPTPLFAEGKNEVFVGRIRRDTSIPSGLNLWIVADNLRKGAATNAVQIVRALIRGKISL
ncbi:MAG: aspartate-semialdehyde dehydrogenase [Bacteroidia bacterium]|nr:aspartate-semialdehyde dehydrogenase [Bacteroidia bacterium]